MHLMNKENKVFFDSYMKEVSEFFVGKLVGEELVKLQNQKLQKVLKYVYQNSPYYQILLNPFKDRFDNFTIYDLPTLPFTTKDTLRDADLSILSQPINKNAYYYETTGTTGKATPCPRNMIDVISSNVTISFAYKSVFESVFGNEKPVVGVFGPTEIHSFGDTLGNVCHNLDLCVVKAWPYSPVVGFEKTLELIERLNIQVIICTPGLAMTLYKAAKKIKYDIERLNIRMIMITGEMCTKEMAENIEDLWNAKVFNFMYGSQEALVMAACNSNNCMNIFPHNYIYEVIDSTTGVSLGFEGEGELTVTMLNPGGKPLIRYRTGDLVRIEKVNSSPLPSSEITIMGRSKDCVTLNEVKFKASQFDSTIMQGLRKCIGYQMIIDSLNNVDEVTIKLEMSDQCYETKSLEENLIMRFEKTFHTKLKVDFTDKLSPVVFTGAMVSWKAARIIDNRKQRTDDERTETQSAQNVLDSGAVKSV